MAHPNPTGSDEMLPHTERTSSTTSLQISSEHGFEIFFDERSFETPHRSTQTSNADYGDLDEENLHSAPTFNFVNKPTPKGSISASDERRPLADITQEVGGRPRSTSDLLAKIASLEDELKLSKKQNEELRGEVVAYQDALHQADEDAGYF